MRVGSTATCSFRLEPEGYVHSIVHPGTRFDMQAAREAVAMTWTVAGERRRPLLVDMRGLVSQAPEARAYFISEEVSRIVSAVALVIGPPVSRMIANFVLRIGKLHVPTRAFESTETARGWLVDLPCSHVTAAAPAQNAGS